MATFEKRQGAQGVRWRAKIRRKGQRSITKTFTRRADAERWAREEERAIDLGRSLPGSEAHHRTLAELIERYVEANPPRTSKRDRERQLIWWSDRLGSHKLAEIRPAMIADGRDALARRPIAAATQNRYLAALSVAMTFAVRELEWMDNNPVRRVRRAREPRGRVRFLDEDERARLLEACQATSDPRLHPLVLVAMASGMRQSEIIRLRWPDINLDTGVAIVHHSKNGERRSVPIAGPALGELRRMSKVRQLSDNRVFAPPRGRSIWPETTWRSARRAAGLEDFRFHDLRHTAASYLAMSGATLAEIAEILGHKTLQMVRRYAHLTESHTVKVAERMAAQFLE